MCVLTVDRTGISTVTLLTKTYDVFVNISMLQNLLQKVLYIQNEQLSNVSWSQSATGFHFVKWKQQVKTQKGHEGAEACSATKMSSTSSSTWPSCFLLNSELNEVCGKPHLSSISQRWLALLLHCTPMHSLTLDVCLHPPYWGPCSSLASNNHEGCPPGHFCNPSNVADHVTSQAIDRKWTTVTYLQSALAHSQIAYCWRYANTSKCAWAVFMSFIRGCRQKDKVVRDKGQACCLAMDISS